MKNVISDTRDIKHPRPSSGSEHVFACPEKCLTASEPSTSSKCKRMREVFLEKRSKKRVFPQKPLLRLRGAGSCFGTFRTDFLSTQPALSKNKYPFRWDLVLAFRTCGITFFIFFQIWAIFRDKMWQKSSGKPLRRFDTVIPTIESVRGNTSKMLRFAIITITLEILPESIPLKNSPSIAVFFQGSPKYPRK